MVHWYLLVSSLLLTFATSDQCRILAFEGGGSRGAYQAGVVQALAYSLPSAEVSWNVISGISTGSLNTMGCIQFPPGEERAMGDFLVDTWKAINGSASSYIEWPYGLIQGLFFKSSLYDSSPLRKFIEAHWLYGIKRNFTIGTTDFNSGKRRVFDESLEPELVSEAVMCSAAPPFYFPPQMFEDTVYVDGGCLVNLDVFSPIAKCRSMGYRQEDIIVDMIFLTSQFLLPVKTPWSTISVYQRVNEIRLYDSTMWFGYYAKRAFPRVFYRYTFVPSQEMPGGEIPLEFDPEAILQEIELGIVDAMKIVKEGKTGLDAILRDPRSAKDRVRRFYRS